MTHIIFEGKDDLANAIVLELGNKVAIPSSAVNWAARRAFWHAEAARSGTNWAGIYHSLRVVSGWYREVQS
jgi:hypothetical protein